MGTETGQNPAESQPAPSNSSSPSDNSNNQAPSVDPFYGKSREDVIRMYEEANTRAEKTEVAANDLKEFVGRVGMFFKVDETNGTVNLNEDMVRQWAAARGIIPPEGSPQNPSNGNIPQTQQDFKQQQNGDEPALDDEQRAYMDRLVEEKLQAVLKQTVLPELETTRTERFNSWIRDVSAKHPDFPKWRNKVAEFMQKKGIRANNVQDLEDAYMATKAVGGGFVDKSQYEQHTGDLLKTLQMIQPGAGQPPLNEAEATTAQLLGLDRQDKNQVAANRELFGKDFLTSE